MQKKLKTLREKKEKHWTIEQLPLQSTSRDSQHTAQLLEAQIQNDQKSHSLLPAKDFGLCLNLNIHIIKAKD